MSNWKQNEYSQWTVVNATTAGPQFVNQAITHDPALAAKTHWVLIYEDQGQLTASVVRDSSSTPGRYSEDRYVWVKTKWSFLRKIEGKWQTFPVPPRDANKIEIHEVPIYTKHNTQPIDVERMKHIMPLLKLLDE